MADQASQLRQRVQRFKNQNETKVISVLSGKGGVGKSVFSLNFSIALSQLGKKVVLIDLDIGMANIEILMGLSPSSDITTMLNERQNVTDILEKGPEGIFYIAGGSGLSDLFKMDELKLTYFFSQLSILSETFDYIIFDLGAGMSQDILSFTISSHEAILLTTTDPTALTDAYAVLKTIHLKDQTLPIKLLVNRCEDDEEGQACASRMQRASRLFLNKELSLLGLLSKDKVVEKAVKKQTPFMIDEPTSKVSIEMRQIAERFTGSQTAEHNPRTFSLFMQRLKNFLMKKDG